MSVGDIKAGQAYVRLYTKDETKQGLSAFRASWSKITVGLAAAAAAMAAVGVAAGGLIRVGGFFVKLAADAETTATSFRVLIGSVEKSTELLRDLKKFAAETPFQFPELADAARQLLGFGVAAEEIQGIIRRLGDISAAVNQPIGELAYLYGTTRVQGRMFTQDLNQFVGRGIPLIQEFAKQFGVADSEVRKLVETGAIGFPELQKAIISLTSEGGKFNGMMAEQSQTLKGLAAALQDDLTMAATKIGELIAKGLELKNSLVTLTEETEKFGQALDEAAPELLEAFGNLNDAVGNFGATISGQMETIEGYTVAFKALAESINVVATGIDSLSTVWALQDAINKTMADTFTAFLMDNPKTPESRAAVEWLQNNGAGAQARRRFAENALQMEGLTPDQLKPQDPFAFRNKDGEATKGPIQGPEIYTPPPAPTPLTPAQRKVIDDMARNRSAPLLAPMVPDFDPVEEMTEEMKRNRAAPVLAFDLPGEGEEAWDNTGARSEQIRRAANTPNIGTFSAAAAASGAFGNAPMIQELKALNKGQREATKTLQAIEKKVGLKFA